MDKLIVCVLLQVLLCAFAQTATGVPAEFRKDEANLKSFTFVGTVEGKSYFMELTRMSWYEAKSRCKNAGFRMATITTPAQADFLHERSYSGTFLGWHWTGGWNKVSIDQFNWEHNNQTIQDTGITFQSNLGKDICLSYRPDIGPRGRLYAAESCYEFCHVLCEIEHGL